MRPSSVLLFDLALRVSVPRRWAEVVGAVLMERLGPYAEEGATPDSGINDPVVLVFYPPAGDSPCDADLLSALPAELQTGDMVRVERQEVPRDWVDGWKAHFRAVVIGRVRVRPPWEPPADAALVDVVINPGLAFGTGLHPTTRGALELLQQDCSAGEAIAPSGPGTAWAPRGALVDVGTGSGILSVSAARLGWGPIIAFDNDAVALVSASQNIAENGVADLVQLRECSVDDAPLSWFAGATVLANMTLGPVLALVHRLAEAPPGRLVASGILSGAQEQELVVEARSLGFCPGRRLYEGEWVSLELLPSGPV